MGRKNKLLREAKALHDAARDPGTLREAAELYRQAAELETIKSRKDDIQTNLVAAETTATILEAAALAAQLRSQGEPNGQAGAAAQVHGRDQANRAALARRAPPAAQPRDQGEPDGQAGHGAAAQAHGHDQAEPGAQPRQASATPLPQVNPSGDWP
jgi:hypothetical protein